MLTFSPESKLEDLNKILTKEDSELDKLQSSLGFSIETNFDFLDTEKSIPKIIEGLQHIVSQDTSGSRGDWVKSSDDNSSESDDASNDLLEEEEDESKLKQYNEVIQEVYKGNINNFLKARELYQSVKKSSSLEGYFYKLSDKNGFGIKYAQVFDGICEIIVRDLEAGQKYLEELSKSGDEEQRIIAEKLVNINFVNVVNSIQNLPETTGKLMRQLQDKYLKGVKENIIDLSKQSYFKEMSRKGKELENSGSVYKPEAFHSWGVNLSWLLAHLKKASKFVVVSDIIINQYRNSPNALRIDPDAKDENSKVREHSAFLREICACLKAGYELKYEDGKTFLYPSIDHHPDNCFSNGLEGNGINTSYQEIEKIFKVLQEGYSSKQNFTYSISKSLLFLKSTVSNLSSDKKEGMELKLSQHPENTGNHRGVFASQSGDSTRVNTREDEKINWEQRLSSLDSQFVQSTTTYPSQQIATTENPSIGATSSQKELKISGWTAFWNYVCCKCQKQNKEISNNQFQNNNDEQRNKPRR